MGRNFRLVARRISFQTPARSLARMRPSVASIESTHRSDLRVPAFLRIPFAFADFSMNSSDQARITPSTQKEGLSLVHLFRLAVLVC